MKKNVLNILPLILAILFFVLLGCNSSKEANDTNVKVQYVIPDSILNNLKIDTVSNSQLINTNTFTGKVTFNEENNVKVYPMVSGNVEDVKVMLGDYVKAGQVLAVIKSTEMAGYNNDLVNAKTNLKLAKKNLDVQRDLFKSGLSSQIDILNAETNYEQANAQLNKVNQILKINKSNSQGDYVVRAPINGFIVEKFITNNTNIRADNGTNIFTISDLQNVWVIANVYESNIHLVHQGDIVSVNTLAYPDANFSGKVDKIMNVLDPSNKVMKVRITLSNKDYLLKPEMFANVTVTNKENKKALSVPSSAIVFDNSQYYVLRYNSKNDVIISPVIVSNVLGDKTFIKSGVNEGDKVISSQVIMIYNALNN
jgi:cobalt-zinc-cadmium efflux system membrane fusion protein